MAVRIPVARFAPDRSQRRCAARNDDLEVRITAATARDDLFALYHRYLTHRHAHGGMDDHGPHEFEQFLIGSWSHTRFMEMRLPGHDGQLGQLSLPAQQLRWGDPLHLPPVRRAHRPRRRPTVLVNRHVPDDLPDTGTATLRVDVPRWLVGWSGWPLRRRGRATRCSGYGQGRDRPGSEGSGRSPSAGPRSICTFPATCPKANPSPLAWAWASPVNTADPAPVTTEMPLACSAARSWATASVTAWPNSSSLSAAAVTANSTC